MNPRKISKAVASPFVNYKIQVRSEIQAGRICRLLCRVLRRCRPSLMKEPCFLRLIIIQEIGCSRFMVWLCGKKIRLVLLTYDIYNQRFNDSYDMRIPVV